MRITRRDRSERRWRRSTSRRGGSLHAADRLPVHYLPESSHVQRGLR
jgi:hypothetical protein